MSVHELTAIIIVWRKQNNDTMLQHVHPANLLEFLSSTATQYLANPDYKLHCVLTNFVPDGRWDGLFLDQDFQGSPTTQEFLNAPFLHICQHFEDNFDDGQNGVEQ